MLGDHNQIRDETCHKPAVDASIKTRPIRLNLKWTRNIFIAVTVALTAGLGGQLLRLYGDMERALTINFEIVELQGTIIYLDEVLTMSARMAMATGDLLWRDRYQSFVVELDEAIAELQATAPLTFSEFTGQTDEANQILLTLENQAFDLLQQGYREQAAAILLSDSYAAQKAQYAEGMEILGKRLLVQRESTLTKLRSTVLTGLGQVLVAIIVLVSLWIAYARALRRAHAQAEDLAQGKRIQRELFEMSITDSLTGLYNRRHAMIRLDEEIARAKRYRVPLSVLLIDLDNFKRVNDEYGHPCGDEVLRSFSKLLVETCRTTDLVSRYGGEEFVITLPNTQVHDANLLANRICDHTRLKTFQHEAIQLTVTCSIGVAEYPSAPCTLEKLMHNADVALYQSKASGRNRVTVAAPAIPGLQGLN